jgi:hypothetical protein
MIHVVLIIVSSVTFIDNLYNENHFIEDTPPHCYSVIYLFIYLLSDFDLSISFHVLLVQ